MTENEAICVLIRSYSYSLNDQVKALKIAIKALEEIQEYRKIGTVEELKKSLKGEDDFKFYYCESEDDYYIGKDLGGNMYYAKYQNNGFAWFMSRYLPWGEHIVAPHTLWKEHTYPSKPKEIPFFEWLQGFMKKYCGGTVEECREAVERTKKKSPVKDEYNHDCCPNCGYCVYDDAWGGIYLIHCENCGQAIRWEKDWRAKNERN